MSEAATPGDLPGLTVDGVSRPAAPAPPAVARVKPVDRSQMVFRHVDVERLIEEDHPARAVWEFVGRLDLQAFYAGIGAVEGVAGRLPWDPRLLASLWIYAYSRGVSSARELARRCGYEPAFQWLTGLGEINHHTLSDFRVAHGAALEQLSVEALGLLSAEGMIGLERVMHDGTKIKAFASAGSFRSEERIQEHLAAAREQVRVLGAADDEAGRHEAARQRVVRERGERLERALGELQKIRAVKKDPEARAAARASTTDPEARVMKQANGGYAPSYNVQLSTDAANKIIVGAGVSQSGNDCGELLPAVARVEQNLGARPEQMITDTGFIVRENITGADALGVDLVGPWPEGKSGPPGQLERRGIQEDFYPAAFAYDAAGDAYRCPAGQMLPHRQCKERRGRREHYYRAAAGVCAGCPFKSRCCPKAARGRSIVRLEEGPEVSRFLEKMTTPAARELYRQRSEVAEFPNAWIKDKLGLRQFRLRGLARVRMEVLWACLTYNIQQWIRLRWRPQAATAA